MAAVALAGCAQPMRDLPMSVRPVDGRPEVILSAPAPIGDMRLWVPEGVMSNTGCCSLYPLGGPWTKDGDSWRQTVSRDQLFGPGNAERIDEHTIDLVGVRFPVDSAVEWQTVVTPTPEAVVFTIRVTNVGPTPIRRAGAAICLKFFHADWWTDPHVFVQSDGAVRSLADLGRDAGSTNGVFQAYPMAGESFDNIFYHSFWGMNRHRLDAPVMVSEDADAGVCVGITGDRAYFLHSNKANPCTDIMLALGDIGPGETAQATGRVWVRRGRARDLLTALHAPPHVTK